MAEVEPRAELKAINREIKRLENRIEYRQRRIVSDRAVIDDAKAELEGWYDKRMIAQAKVDGSYDE